MINLNAKRQSVLNGLGRCCLAKQVYKQSLWLGNPTVYEKLG
jgi:hypothetical protein